MNAIYHICTAADWRAAQEAGQYASASLSKEGFIHCSSRDQVLRIANTVFRGQRGLVLLHIDEDHLDAEVRYENCEGGTEPFPHVYGPVSREAVAQAAKLEPEPDGTFRWPGER